MNDLNPSPARLQPRRAVIAATAFLALFGCGTAHTRSIDRSCYDDLRIFTAQQEAMDRQNGIDLHATAISPIQAVAAIQPHDKSIQACSEHLLPNERDGGKITFDLLVDSKGKVAKACATQTEYDNAEFNACALREIRKATFARSPKSGWSAVRWVQKFE